MEVASGDVIDAERRTILKICGTHQGNFMSMPPTGKRVMATGIGI
jgi:predicted ester cyclase